MLLFLLSSSLFWLIKIWHPSGKLRDCLSDQEILATEERTELSLIKEGNATNIHKLIYTEAYMPGTIPGLSSPLILKITICGRSSYTFVAVKENQV